MTQEELASGVVSVSYLSKIEHNNAEANQEAIVQLCKKLNINPVQMKDQATIALCHQWYRELLQQDYQQATETYAVLTIDMEKIIDADLFWTTEIHRLYYYLLTKQNSKARKQFQYLDRHSYDFKGMERYYWFKFSGYYFYQIDLSYLQANERLKKAEQAISQSINQYQEELYDLYFLIALVSNDLYFTYHTMVYAEKALAYYRSIYQLNRCAICHILIGKAHKRMNEYQQAEKSFQLALKIAGERNDYTTLAASNLALGNLYKKTAQSTKAINYYHRSYQIAKNHAPEQILQAILHLMKEYLHQQDLSQAKVWHEKATQFFQENDQPSSLHFYETKVYGFIIHGLDHHFESLMVKQVLPFLKQRSLYTEYSWSVHLLAKYYYQNRRYKLAADHFQEAYQAMASLRLKDNL